MGLGLRINKHLPGEHDQQTHGRRGSTAGQELDDDHRRQHQPSGVYGAQFHDMGQLVNKDIYDHPEWYFSMSEPYNREGARIMQRVKGKPDAPVKIYRAIPKGAQSEIQFGDWVTTVESYAVVHGDASLQQWESTPTGDGLTTAGWDYTRIGPGYEIISDVVPAKDLMWPGDSMVEFGWFPGNVGMQEDDIAKHTPGGVAHDQSTHGRKGDGQQQDTEGATGTGETLTEGLISWKVDPDTMSRHMGDIVDGVDWDVTPENLPDQNRARAILGALKDAPEIDYDLWRGQSKLPRSMTRAGDTVPDVGDEFSFNWVGASATKSVAMGMGWEGYVFEFTGKKRAFDVEANIGTEHHFVTEREHLMSGTFRITGVRQERKKHGDQPYGGEITVIGLEQTDHWIGDNKRFEKHTPGGVEHEQDLHGNWSDGERKDPKGLGVPSPQIPGLSQPTAPEPTGPSHPILAEGHKLKAAMSAVRANESLSDEEYKAQGRIASDAYFDWKNRVEDAISMGEITIEQAEDEGGFLDDGHGKWEPLPPDLWHVTMAGSKVREEGLKDRKAVLAQDGVQGLGGGTDTMISFASDEKIGQDLLLGMKEARSVASGETTLKDLMNRAKAGDAGSEPFYDDWVGNKDAVWLEELSRGQTREKLILGRTLEEATEKILARDPDATNIVGVPDSKLGDDYFGSYIYTMGDKARRQDTFNLYQTFAGMREIKGGPTDPYIWGADVDQLGSVPDEEIQLLRFKPKPGTMGKNLGHGQDILAEWRTGTGDAVELVDDIAKHGTHDQKTHGNWADGVAAFQPTEKGSAFGKAVRDFRKEFAALPDDALVMVYHATTQVKAKEIAEGGLKIGDKPMTLPRRRYEAGEYAEFAPGAGISGGTYVSGNLYNVEGYGNSILAMKVPKGSLKVPPEGRDRPLDMILMDHDGAVVTADVPASNIINLYPEHRTHIPAFPPDRVFDAVAKHLPGKHDQKTHGNWATSWGTGESYIVDDGIVEFGSEIYEYGGVGRNDPTIIGEETRYLVDGHRVAVRYFNSPPELTQFHIDLIRGVPQETWDATRDPIITFTDTRYMTTMTAPSGTPTNAVANGLYWAGKDVTDTRGWTVQGGDVSNQVFLLDGGEDLGPAQVQHNLMHELGHSIWFHDVYMKDDWRPLRDNFDHFLNANPPPVDPPLFEAFGSSSDLWDYPRAEFQSGAETFAEMFAYMSYPTHEVEVARQALVAENTYHDRGFETINVYDWISDHMGGSVEHMVPAIAKAIIAGFAGECGVPELTRLMLTRNTDGGFGIEKRLVGFTKHYPGGQDHDQSNHGRKGNPRQLGPNPGQTGERGVHGAPRFHVLYDTRTLAHGYKPLRLPNGDFAKFTLDDALESMGEKGSAAFLKTVHNKFDQYGIEPDLIESRIQTVLDSALDRYDRLNTLGESGLWMEADELPSWMDDISVEVDRAKLKEWTGETPAFITEMEADIDALVEYREDGQWRWKPGAGDALADVDNFYDVFHGAVLEGSRESGYTFDQGAAVTALISPQHKAIPNLVSAIDLMQLTDADNPITGIVKENTITKLQARFDVLSGKAKPNVQQRIDILESRESLDLLNSGDRRPSELPPMGHLFGINEQRRLLTGGAGFQAATGWNSWTDSVMVLRGEMPADGIVGIKRRAFSNNIMDPLDTFDRGDTTIDFHIMNAGNMMVGSDDVSQLTGAKVSGVSVGVRAHFAQALHDVTDNSAGRHPLLTAPLHTQQIVWAEWQRGSSIKDLTWTSSTGEVHPLMEISGDTNERIVTERAS